MAREDLQQLAISFLEAFNDGDWERYAEIIAPDATYYERGSERTAHSARRSVAILRQYRGITPGLKGEPSVWVIDEVTSTVAVQIVWSQVGTENPVTVPGNFFFTIRGGRIASVSEQHHYGPVGWWPCGITDYFKRMQVDTLPE